VGNRISDMHFGRNAGMYTVFVASTHPETPFPDPAIDLRFNDLLAFAKSVQG
jgi:D-glycero-D-manno-heptose 1,7-bisphosphate phosphatase